MRRVLLVAACLSLGGCVYYNGVYNAYENAEYARYLYNQQGWGPWSCRP